MESLEIQRFDGLEAACEAFRRDLRKWALDCMGRYGPAEPTDGHDQLTYTTGWEPWLRGGAEPEILAFLKRSRDAAAERFTERGLWRHGYWRMQEAHHGTEHFQIFLGFLHRLDPDDGETRRQLLDAAEHIGNWSAEVPPWFDESTGLFRSFHFGADGVGEGGAGLNVPDHLRCLGMALAAHGMSGDPRYLEWSVRYGCSWADAILGGPRLPAGLTPDGPSYRLGGERERAYRSFAGMAGSLEDDLDRAENMLASGGIDVLLSLWRLSGDGRFRAAAERLLDVLATELRDPDAAPAADAVRAYRTATRSSRFDGAVLEALDREGALAVRSIALVPGRKDRRPRPPGIGKRADAPMWLEDGLPRRHGPVLLGLAAEVSGDRALATRAVEMARTCFLLARQSLPDGREHGCAASTVSAVACGHGRDNRAGMATAVLGPLEDAFGLGPRDQAGSYAP